MSSQYHLWVALSGVLLSGLPLSSACRSRATRDTQDTRTTEDKGHREVGAKSPSPAMPASPADTRGDEWRTGRGPLTAEDLTRLRRVVALSISPDGQHIAYTRTRPRIPFVDEDGPAWVELHVVARDGTSRPFVTGQVDVHAIRWLPNGAGISYLDKRPGEKHDSLYFIPIDGGESRRVLVKEGIQIYDWHPDSTRVAYVATEPPDKQRKKRAKQGLTARIYEEDWRPVRLWVATVDLTGTTPAKDQVVDLEGVPGSPVWDPAGERLAITLAPTPLVNDTLMNRRLQIISVDDRGKIDKGVEIEHTGKLGSFSWSPDGKHLALIGTGDRNDPAEGRLMIATVADGKTRDLLPGLEGHVGQIAWKNESTLVYVLRLGLGTTLSQIGLTGDPTILVDGTPGGPIFGGLMLSRDGTYMALSGDSPAHPTEVFAGPVGSPPRRLTDSNPWLANRPLARQEPVRYQARDGTEIEGVLLLPLSRKGTARVPLILVVHGGPEARTPNGWVTSYWRPGQVAAGKGYAVFYPNYRGSTGRGVEFSKLGQADTGGKEFDDLVDAISHLVDRGLVDKTRVGITGASYGGFASAWAATKLTEHFAASVMLVGISDQISKAGTTDIPDEMEASHTRRWAHDYWEWFLERSPIYHVKQARTPILIVHGEKDTRVHPAQALELHRHLKLLGKVPVRLVLYPEEGHGNRKAAARYDYSLRMLRWMDHYLTGPGGDPPPRELTYPLEAENAKAEDEE